MLSNTPTPVGESRGIASPFLNTPQEKYCARSPPPRQHGTSTGSGLASKHWYARGYLAHDPRRHVFWSFYLATAAGNLGVCLAGDAASFYLLFALMTFAAYGLVVHNGSAEAHRAGRVYLIMAVLGEAALVAGMLLAVHAASSHYLTDLAGISQMGFMTMGVGAGLLAPQLWPVLLPAVGLYALHHALAKSALFLGVGVIQTGADRRWVLVGMALPALSLAGAPLTSGLLAKTALKAGLAGLPAPWDALLPVLLPLAALGTALLMARLLLLLAHIQAHGGSGLAAPWWMLVALGALLPWIRPAFNIGTWVSALWPILLAAAIAALFVRSGLRAPALPPGDILLFMERMLHHLRLQLLAASAQADALIDKLKHLIRKYIPLKVDFDKEKN